jgi:uncharacterized membrane protein YozB (DUF420 family)
MSLHCIERDDYINKPLCPLAETALVPLVCSATHLLFSMTKIVISIVFINSSAIRSHKHICDVTNMLLIFFWIKVYMNLPNILTIQKLDKQFCDHAKTKRLRTHVIRDGITGVCYG